MYENNLNIFNKQLMILMNLLKQNNIISPIEYYLLSVADILFAYNNNYGNKSLIIDLNIDYIKILRYNDILNFLNTLFFSSVIKNPNYERLKNQWNYYNTISLPKFKSSCCSCDISQRLSDNLCLYCGYPPDNTNSIMDIDFHHAHNPTSLISTTRYDFIRHYRIWLEKILAINDKYLNKYLKEYNLLRDYILREYPLLTERKNITAIQFREILKKLHLTKLNDIITTLMKKICHIHIPNFTPKEFFDLENIFIQVIKVYDTIKETNEVNRKYYPYFIYKIIEFYFRNNREKLKILNYIHLQKKKTLVINDLKWKSICSKISNIIEYKDTIRIY